MGRLVYFVNNANYPAHPCLLRNLRNYYFSCKWQWQNFVEQIIVSSPKNNIKSQTAKMNFDKLLGKPVFKNHNCNPSQSFQIFLLLYLPCYVYLFWFFERLFLCFTPFGDSSGYNNDTVWILINFVTQLIDHNGSMAGRFTIPTIFHIKICTKESLLLQHFAQSSLHREDQTGKENDWHRMLAMCWKKSVLF